MISAPAGAVTAVSSVTVVDVADCTTASVPVRSPSSSRCTTTTRCPGFAQSTSAVEWTLSDVDAEAAALSVIDSCGNPSRNTEPIAA